LLTAILVASLLLATATTAFGEFDISETRTLGVGRIHSVVASEPLSLEDKLVLEGAEEAVPSISSTSLTTPIDREVNRTQLATSTPVASTAETSAPNSSSSSNNGGGGAVVGEWQTGKASAYGGWFIGRNTANGTLLTEESMGVAVPMEWRHLLNTYVEIEYNGMVVTVIINDVGGFGYLGRVLDLQPGLWRYFGFDSYDNWGVRNVRYRFLG
jgi:rare lipoprotein A (peptidoglycan hydrolase)